MSPLPERQWRVLMTTWDAWDITVPAPDAETAELRAEELWREDIAALTHRDGGISGITVEPAEAEVAL